MSFAQVGVPGCQEAKAAVGHRILLVEDQFELANQVGASLRAVGYQVIDAANGAQALERLKRQEPHLLLLDWMLPDMNGIEVLQQFRQRSLAPVMMMSGKANAMDRVLGLELGADDYLPKPFHLGELAARVRALLRRSEKIEASRRDDRQTSSQQLKHGPLVLNPLAREVGLNGETIHLTKTEFQLLQLLLKNPGRAFSRAYLLETLWEDVAAGCDRSVDNTVLKLRKKLAPWSQNLETVWGMGYRLKPASPA